MPILETVKIDDCKNEVLFSYNKEKVASIVDSVARDIGKHHKIKGSRQGKASIEAVKIAAKKAVLENAGQQLLNDAFQDILFETKWKPFSQPEVKDMNVTFGSFSAKLTIGYSPEFELTKYKDFEFAQPENSPNNEALFDKLSQNICKNFAETKLFAENDFVLTGDKVIVDFHATINGEDFEHNKASAIPVEVGKGKTVDGFEDNLIGMRVGEEREFDLSFNENFPNKTFAGKIIHFKVNVVNAARDEPATFDEELAKKMNFDSLDLLKEDVMNQAAQYKKEMEFGSLKVTAINNLIESNNVPVPEWMILQTSENTAKMQHKNFASLSNDEKKVLFDETKRNISLAFIIEEVKGLEAETVLTQYELSRILHENISKMPENMQAELVNGKNYALYSKILNDIQIEYVIKWVVDHSTVVAKGVE